MIDWDRLISEAQKARDLAYAPYSDFKVGAALLCADGTIIVGCNVENVSFGLTNCAERTALFAAVAQGKRDFLAMAICADTAKVIVPCGACRQVMIELAPHMELMLVGKEKKHLTTVEELLPYSFDESFLKDDMEDKR